MLTTGLKQMIINVDADILYDGTDNLSLFGATNISAAKIKNLAIYATKAMNGGKFTYTLTVPASTIAIGDVVTVVVDFTTMRNQGEFNNDRLDGSDPLMIQVIATGTSATTLATDIVTELTGGAGPGLATGVASEMQIERWNRYKLSAVDNAGGALYFTTNEWSVVPTELTVQDSAGVSLNVTYVRVVTTAPNEGVGLPKMIEEKVKHNTFNNTSMYAMDPNGQLDKTSTYNVIEIDVLKASDHAMNSSIVNGSLGNVLVSYQIFVNSSIDLFTQAIIKVVVGMDEFDTASMLYYDAAPVVSGTSSTTPATTGVGTENGYAKLDGKLYVA